MTVAPTNHSSTDALHPVIPNTSLKVLRGILAGTNSSEDFFLAGREMTAWVAGLSFVAANMGALELMGWAASTYEYGLLAAHWYWIGAVPAMLFLALIMMPFYYVAKTHSVPGYLKQRFGEPTRALTALSFVGMTVLMSGINMFAMAKVMQVVLGWNMNLSILVSSLTVAAYVTLGGRSVRRIAVGADLIRIPLGNRGAAGSHIVLASS
jgi:Na+/proline symporter